MCHQQTKKKENSQQFSTGCLNWNRTCPMLFIRCWLLESSWHTTGITEQFCFDLSLIQFIIGIPVCKTKKKLLKKMINCTTKLTVTVEWTAESQIFTKELQSFTKIINKIFSHPDGQHDMGVALQDLHCIAVGDVIKAHPIGCKDLVTHFDAMLLCKPTWVQPEDAYKNTHTFIWYTHTNVIQTKSTSATHSHVQ